jgi:nicotinate-nucleotide--dimethylbenzimidazole phosphoribosyltransferase
VETGIALLLATADRGLDVVALGQLGAGCEIVSAALVAALSSAPAEAVAAAEDLAAVRDALDAAAGPALSPLTALEQLGGFDIAVLTGIILGAAAIHVPVVLDDHGTSSAALVASRMCPAVSGYLVAAHTGTHPAHRGALAALELQPLFDLGLAQGEGSGAVLALSFIDAASALSCQLAGDPPT